MEARFCDACGSQIVYASWHHADGYDFCKTNCLEYFKQNGQSALTNSYDSPKRD
jgi:hypothetical protein